jgi:hypothetical protein
MPKVIKFKEGNDVFLKVWLIDTSVNVNAWRVLPESIPKNIESVIGKPIVLASNYDHPPIVDREHVEPNLQYQERFAIARYVKYFVDGSTYWGIAKVTDPLAAEAIDANDIPLTVSPRLFRLDTSEPMDRTTKWIFVHSAIVDKPAYGDRAVIDAVCEGSNAHCVPALLSASKDDGVCSCVKTALLKLVNNEPPLIDTSQFADSKNSQTSMPEATKEIDLSGYVPRADYEKLSAEHNTLQTLFSDSKKEFERRIASVEEERRADKISTFVSAKISDPKKAGELVKQGVA